MEATHKVPFRDGWPVTALVYLAAVAIVYACLKLYDEPVRAWLKKKVLVDGSEAEAAKVSVLVE